MIVQFKPVSMDKFQGQFNGVTITIERQHNETQRSMWAIFVDGKRTTATPRPTAKNAMAVVEHIANKILCSANTVAPAARQRQLSPTGRHNTGEAEVQNIPVPSHQPGKSKYPFKRPHSKPQYVAFDYGKLEERILAAQTAGMLGANGQPLVGS